MKKNYQAESHTFVICAYQESPYLEACIRSLLHQSVKSNILIATSTPNSLIRNLAAWYNLPVFINSGEKGLASDWNFAVSCAESPLVTLAHQDDLYGRTYTEHIFAAINLCRKPLIAFTDYYELREGKTVRTSRLLRIKRLMLTPLKLRPLWSSRFVRRRILSLGSAICCPSVTLVKENLACPVFENNMKSNIDWQAWEKISRKKGEFAYIPNPLVAHRIHADSTTSGLLREHGRMTEDLMVYQKFWPRRVARLLEYFYRNSEKSNQLRHDRQNK